MNIHTVRNNLANTIKGKQELLAVLKARPENAVNFVTIQFLQSNLDELQNILKDIELCCEKALEDSWTLSPDRMGQ